MQIQFQREDNRRQIQVREEEEQKDDPRSVALREVHIDF
jgi:hypothetical protein